MNTTRRMVIGCMTGTSLDGLDAALVRVEGRGLDLEIEVMGSESFEFPAELRAGLKACAGQDRLRAGEFANLSREFGEFHAACLQGEWGGGGWGVLPEGIDLVAVHGQTVFHRPPNSWQMINVHPIARALNCAVVFDLRGADLTAGGEGAPITPIVDGLLFADAGEDVWILNFGGFVNYTRLPRIKGARLGESLGEIEAGDLCVCNQLLDRAAARLFGEAFDGDGARARAGEVQVEAAGELGVMLRSLAESGRSLGTGDECFGWLSGWEDRLEPGDLLRTICGAIAEMVVARIEDKKGVVWCAGGGIKNRALAFELEARGMRVRPLVHACGVDGENREAVALAVLGVLCQDGVAITLPQVTGLGDVPAPVAGTWVFAPFAQ